MRLYGQGYSKYRFCLSDKDLKAIPYACFTNPIKIEGSPMRAYRRHDILKLLNQKFGSIAKANDVFMKRRNKDLSLGFD